jgi:hypothetical protein
MICQEILEIMSNSLPKKPTPKISTALGTILSFNTEFTNIKTILFFINEHDIETIDFSDPYAVKALNKSLLTSYYNIKNWDIPEFYLCPPGRADYIHYVADLIATTNNSVIQRRYS